MSELKNDAKLLTVENLLYAIELMREMSSAQGFPVCLDTSRPLTLHPAREK